MSGVAIVAAMALVVSGGLLFGYGLVTFMVEFICNRWRRAAVAYGFLLTGVAAAGAGLGWLQRLDVWAGF